MYHGTPWPWQSTSDIRPDVRQHTPAGNYYYDTDVTHRGSKEVRSRWRRGRTDGWGGLVRAVGWERDVVGLVLWEQQFAAMATANGNGGK